MRNFFLGLGGLFFVALVYYFTMGSSQITAEIKKRVNTELHALQKEGFTVEKRKVEKHKDYFVLSFEEPQKIIQFLARQGIKIAIGNTDIFKGLKLGVDVSYLADAYSAVTLDIYPLSLPYSLISLAQSNEDKKILRYLRGMLENKTFLLHLSINKLANGFKGYMKDIHEVVPVNAPLTLKMNKMIFSGDIKDKALQSVKQTLESFTFTATDELDIHLKGLRSNYLVTGKTAYDYTVNYGIEKLSVSLEPDMKLLSDTIFITTKSSVKDGLISGDMLTNIAHIDITDHADKYTVNTLTFKALVDNLDKNSMEKLQRADKNDHPEINALLQQLITKGVKFTIPNLSTESIIMGNKKMKGFTLSSAIFINRRLNIAILQANPMSAITAINAKLDLALSRELFTFIARQPEVIMAIMMFQPELINGQQTYAIELQNGKLIVNGRAAF